MFSKSIQLIFVSVVTLFLGACGVGLDDAKGPNPELVEKNKALLKTYKSIEGIYTGTVTNSQSGMTPFPANLILYADTTQESALDEDLQQMSRVILRGRLERTDLLGDSDNLILIGSYNAATGELDLKPDPKQPRLICDAGARVPIELRGSLKDSVLNASISREGRTWAFIKSSLTTRDVIGKSQGNGEEDFLKQREVYQPLVGTYEGLLKQFNTDGEEVSEQVSMLVYLVEVKKGETDTGEACFRPMLNARFLRDHQGEFHDVIVTNVRYYADKKEVQMVGQSEQKEGSVAEGMGSRSSGGRTEFSLWAKVDESVKGTIYSNGVSWGRIELAKKSSTANAPAQGEEALERERRLKTYAEVTGTYRGEIVPDTGSTPWNVELVIFVVEEQAGMNPNGEPRFLPALRARYRRPDFSHEVGERLLTVRYYLESGVRKLSMNASPVPGVPTNVPGAGTFSITGEIVNDMITADAADHRGPMGELRAKRKP